MINKKGIIDPMRLPVLEADSACKNGMNDIYISILVFL